MNPGNLGKNETKSKGRKDLSESSVGMCRRAKKKRINIRTINNNNSNKNTNNSD